MLDDVYRSARSRVTTLAITLDATQLTSHVPATPEWTVHDVIAHLVGGAADAACGRVEGAPGEQWTARHVAERRDRPVDELLAEWQQASPAVEASLAGQQFTGPNLAADIICHEADLHEALGLPRVDRIHWHRPFLEVLMLRLNQRLQTITQLVVSDEYGQTWNCGSGEPAMHLNADGYELFRAMFTRRSRRQIRAWNWTPEPSEQVVEAFGVFGTRDDDQPIPDSGPTTN